jgi:cephalosporin hydroxylase
MNELNQIQGWFGDPEIDVLTPYVTGLTGLLVEIGSFHGKSTLFFRLANPNIQILTIDVCNETGILKEHDDGTIVIPDSIDKEVLAYGNIFQVKGNSHDVVKRFNWKIDFLFLDALHSYQDTLDGLNEWKRFIKPGHYIACHDYATAFPGVIHAVKDSKLPIVEERNGIAVLQP